MDANITDKMAKDNSHWKDVLRATQQEGNRSDNRFDPREKKKVARQHYIRRKLDKDIKKYTNSTNQIKYKEIERIAKGYGF